MDARAIEAYVSTSAPSAGGQAAGRSFATADDFLFDLLVLSGTPVIAIIKMSR